jgi:hypothetical protein
MEVMGYRIALGEPSIEVGTGDLCHRLYRRAIHETVCFPARYPRAIVMQPYKAARRCAWGL